MQLGVRAVGRQAGRSATRRDRGTFRLQPPTGYRWGGTEHDSAGVGDPGELAVGSTAIGQGMVQASVLEMATVAATIADGGRRPTPTFGFARGSSTRAIGASVARTVRGLMIDVVRFGTGTAAAIPGVVVAGKTGTAELGDPRSCASESNENEASSPEGEAASSQCSTEQSDPHNTDAWFASFAPALHPRIAVAVLMVRDGAGGDTAAPVARQVLEAGLR